MMLRWKREKSFATLGIIFILVSSCDFILGDDRRVSTIVVTPSVVSFDATQDTRSLSVEVFDQDGAVLSNVGVRWTSSDPAVAQVSPDGLVTASGNGSASVFASAESVEGVASVTVRQVATTIAVAGGDAQSGEVGEALPVPLRVLLSDRLGGPAADIQILFEVLEGDGTVAAAAVPTSSAGTASTDWFLGEVAGSPQSMTAAVAGESPLSVMFTAGATAGPADEILKEAGDGQAAQRQTALPEPLSIQVLDRFDNPVEDTLITWDVLTGGGDVDPGSALTDVTGHSFSQWLLGETLGAQQVTAMAQGLAEPAIFSAMALAIPDQIQIEEGDAQTATVGEPVPTPPQIRLLDSQGLPVPQTVSLSRSRVAVDRWRSSPQDNRAAPTKKTRSRALPSRGISRPACRAWVSRPMRMEWQDPRRGSSGRFPARIPSGHPSTVWTRCSLRRSVSQGRQPA